MFEIKVFLSITTTLHEYTALRIWVREIFSTIVTKIKFPRQALAMVPNKKFKCNLIIQEIKYATG